LTRTAKFGIVAALWFEAGPVLEGRRNPFVAREGVPFLIVAAVAFVLALRYLDIAIAIAVALLCFVFILVFRDPRRSIPASPLGVVSPVDGQVVDIDLADKGVFHGEAHRIHIRIDSFGTYTARAPVEGKIMDLRSVDADQTVDYETNALWLQTDEGDDVVLQFRGYRLGLAPKSFVRFGERVGQGQRCAYLRLTRFAELHLPIASTVLVKPGQVVTAGSDLIGKVPHP
jgi:phosphatidylserine decarboxylase